MKKITAVILVAGILFSLCACGNKSKVSVIETEPQATESEEITVAETEATVTETETETETVIDSALWKAAFKKYYSKKVSANGFETTEWSRLYITDIDGDSVPEVIDQIETWYPTVVFYDADRDIVSESNIHAEDIAGNSSPFGEYPNMLYIDKENHCLIIRSEAVHGSSLGNRQAVVYEVKNGKVTEKDSMSLDFDFSGYDLADEKDLGRAMDDSEAAFKKQFAAFTKGRTLIDYGKVSVTGNKIINELNKKFDAGLKVEYITDKKPVAFSRGYIKNGVYYNEWANLKIASPESWSKETYDRPYKLELLKTNPDDNYEAGITLYAVEGPVDLIFKEMAIEDSSTIKRESETAVFAGEKYYVWDYYQKTASGFDVFGMFSDYCVRYYYREFDGCSIVISIISTPTNEMDAYTSYISKIK